MKFLMRTVKIFFVFLILFTINVYASTSIKNINDLNSLVEEVDSHSGETNQSRLETNFRDTITLSRENLSSDNEDLDNIVYPRLTKLEKETDDGYKYILTFQNTSTGLNNNGINVYYTRSKDLKTWDTPVILYKSEVNSSKNWYYTNGETEVLNDGTIMAVASKYLLRTYNWLPADFNECGIYVRFSEDNGATWTDEKQIYSGMCWEPSILELDSGEIQVYFTRNCTCRIYEW